MRKSIALIYGGNSEEAEISIKSGKNVAGSICREKYDVYEVLLRGVNWRVLNPDGGQVDMDEALGSLKDPQSISAFSSFRDLKVSSLKVMVSPPISR